MKHRKTVLVTGGAGFIGSNFVRHLLGRYPDYRVVVLDHLTYAGNPENFNHGVKENERFSFWYGNVLNSEMVNTLVSQSDVVVHMAAETHVARSIFDNAVFFQTDVMGTQVVANAVLKNPNVERFIHISTSEVYGTAEAAPMTEEHPLNPRTPYASAKAGADRLVYSYAVTYGIPAVIVRPFNNYGPYQHLEKVIPRFITSLILGEPLTIHGDGRSSRDWLFVEDHCDALERLMHLDFDKVRGRVINLGTGRDETVNTIAKKVCEISGKPDAKITNTSERPGQVKRHISSTDLAEKLLGWKAKTSLDEGLERTINWYRSNRSWWEKLLWMRTVPIKTEDGKVEYH